MYRRQPDFIVAFSPAWRRWAGSALKPQYMSATLLSPKKRSIELPNTGKNIQQAGFPDGHPL